MVNNKTESAANIWLYLGFRVKNRIDNFGIIECLEVNETCNCKMIDNSLKSVYDSSSYVFASSNDFIRVTLCIFIHTLL